jgi:TRAP-type C4-dicarboxylate transport system substrate-binding protein
MDIAAARAVGFAGTPLGYSECYSAMQQGVVDGGENSIVTYETQKHQEVAKYFTDTRHKYLPMLMVASESFLQSLSPAHQKLALEAGAQSALHARKIYALEIEEKTKKAQAGGALIGKLNAGAEKDFQRALEPVYKKYSERIPGGKETLEAIQSTK